MQIAPDILDHIDNRLDKIPGWLPPEAAYFTAYLLSYQKEINMTGDTLEIGVFHGKYLSLLYLFSRKQETVYGIDAFLNTTDKQAPLDRVFDNISRFCGDTDRLRIIVENTLDITPEDLIDKTASGIRFISVDGGHTSDVVYHDLCLAKSVLKEGGVIALDDAFNHTTPGVNEGMYEFMLSKNKDGHLAAFAHCYNKAFFTTSKHHKEYLQLAYRFLKDMRQLPACQRTKQRIDENRNNDFVPEMYGREIVSFL
jgi:SAM-dependent methyltransferase